MSGLQRGTRDILTVDVGIRQLDEESGTYNIKGAFETALDVSRQRIHTLNLLQNAIYAVNTLASGLCL